jgi:hypothetical protein
MFPLWMTGIFHVIYIAVRVDRVGLVLQRVVVDRIPQVARELEKPGLGLGLSVLVAVQGLGAFIELFFTY